ncbi:MAG: hypothetical protein IH623_08325 [Verrucomicrobia bacterium]|nr:hypothetical protein [Verrucomicrobiota bacterium]
MHWKVPCGKLKAGQGNIGHGQLPQCQRLVWCMNGLCLERTNSPKATRMESLNGGRRRVEAERGAQQESPPPYLDGYPRQTVGGLGFGCSGNVVQKLAVFETTHASAPKYAGQ